MRGCIGVANAGLARALMIGDGYVLYMQAGPAGWSVVIVVPFVFILISIFGPLSFAPRHGPEGPGQYLLLCVRQSSTWMGNQV